MSKYQEIREELKLSRDKASELLESITPERLSRVENGTFPIRPDEVLLMSQVYKKPGLCNYYCSQECPIGKKYVPKVEVKELSAIVLEMLASLNSVDKKKERLIEITADGKIDKTEIDDFIYIQDELERISITVETLQLWVEKMLANGVIDMKAYEERRKK